MSVDVDGVDTDVYLIEVFTPHTLVREAGDWYEYIGPITVEAMERADQVRGADKSTRWCFFHGKRQMVDKDIARELAEAGFGDRLRLVEKPKPPAVRVVEPAYDGASARAEISELRALVAAQGEQLARLEGR